MKRVENSTVHVRWKRQPRSLVVQLMLIVTALGMALGQNTGGTTTPMPGNGTLDSSRNETNAPGTVPPTPAPSDSPSNDFPSGRPSDSRTIQPTLSPSVTPRPSESPSLKPSASLHPSASPSQPPSDLPSSLPSSSLKPSVSPRPSESPSASLMPSASLHPSASPSQFPSDLPSSSPSSSLKPSASLHPSASPSQFPTNLPSSLPTQLPSFSPTISAQPTASSQPTLSSAPSTSTQPSDSPSARPSHSPSLVPTISVAPSTSPSDAPSYRPSVSAVPSLVPSLSSVPSSSIAPSSRPSQFPSTTHVPSLEPSTIPSSTFSLAPSTEPSAIPSEPPTLLTEERTEDTIRMVIEGFPSELNQTEKGEWQDMTSQHVFNYYDELNVLIPGQVPINVTKVETIFKGQRVLSAKGDRFSLEIEYSQTIVFGLWDKEKKAEEEDITFYIFVAPFEYDAQSYLIAMIEKWGLGWIDLISIEVGELSLAPSQAPSEAGTKTTTSPWVIYFAVSIVVVAILVVSYLLYDRYRNEDRYRRSEVRANTQSTEFGNAGQPVDWRNPSYHDAATSSGGAPRPPQDNPVSDDPHHRRTDNTMTTAAMTQATGGTGSRHSRGSLGLPPLAPGTSTRSSSGSAMLPPPQSPHDRQFSDITYAPYSDGGPRSDSGSDIGPAMPGIIDERFPSEGGTPLSPLHIPDEEEGFEFSDLSPPPSPPRPDARMLGLEPEQNSPSMSGFDMQIEELE